MKLNRKTRALLNRREILRRLHLQFGYHIKTHAEWECRIQKHESGEDWMPDSLVEMFRERAKHHDEQADKLIVDVAKAEKPYLGERGIDYRKAPILSILHDDLQAREAEGAVVGASQAGGTL